MPFFCPSLIETLTRDSGGLMRQFTLLVSALFLFVVAFTVIYVSFRTSTAAIKGVVGGGFFLLASLFLLWKDWRPRLSEKAAANASDRLSQ